MNQSNHTPFYVYRIDLSVRISDINYGNHLGHAELIKITHQARWKLLIDHGLKENDIGGAGILVKHLSIDYQGEAFFDDVLNISISITELKRASCTFSYSIIKNQSTAVASVKENIVFLDNITKKIVRVPSEITRLQFKSDA